MRNYAGADRKRILEERAKAEGALTLYTTVTRIAPLIERFNVSTWLRLEHSTKAAGY